MDYVNEWTIIDMKGPPSSIDEARKRMEDQKRREEITMKALCKQELKQ